MADSKNDPIDFTDGKGKTATVTAERNIPLSLLLGDRAPTKFARHPGGARVERGTTVTVSADGAAYLKTIGYAK